MIIISFLFFFSWLGKSLDLETCRRDRSTSWHFATILTRVPVRRRLAETATIIILQILQPFAAYVFRDCFRERRPRSALYTCRKVRFKFLNLLTWNFMAWKTLKTLFCRLLFPLLEALLRLLFPRWPKVFITWMALTLKWQHLCSSIIATVWLINSWSAI